MDKQDDENSSEEGFPKSLITSWEAAKAAGTYDDSLEAFVNVNYLIFRTRFSQASGREPSSRVRWLKALHAFEQDCEAAESKNTD